MSQPGQHLLLSFLQALQLTLRTAKRPDNDPVATRDALALAERVPQRLLVEASPAADGNHGAAQQPEPLSLEAMQSHLQQRYPDAGLQVLAIRELAGGRSKRTLMISLLANDLLPANLVLRQDKLASAQRTSVGDEYPALRALHGAAVPVAEPLWLQGEANSLGALHRLRCARSCPASVATVWRCMAMRILAMCSRRVTGSFASPTGNSHMPVTLLKTWRSAALLLNRSCPGASSWREYRSAGGPEVSEPQLRFFRIWTYLRNFCFATLMRDRLAAGAPTDMQSLMIAVDAQPRLEALLLQALADETTHTEN